jgi:ribosomal protein S18
MVEKNHGHLKEWWFLSKDFKIKHRKDHGYLQKIERELNTDINDKLRA